MSLVIFCLLFSFIDYVPVRGEIIWYNFLMMLPRACLFIFQKEEGGEGDKYQCDREIFIDWLLPYVPQPGSDP